MLKLEADTCAARFQALEGVRALALLAVPLKPSAKWQLPGRTGRRLTSTPLFQVTEHHTHLFLATFWKSGLLKLKSKNIMS